MMKVRGAYEAITGLGVASQDYVNDNYMEYGVESSLNFPQFMFPFLSSNFKKKIRATSEVGLKFTSQVRPEFSRTLASASWSYKWTDRKRMQHRLDLVDVNYVYMPRKSSAFQEYLDSMSLRNSALKASYENQLVVRTGYSFTYNSAGNAMMRTPTKIPILFVPILKRLVIYCMLLPNWFTLIRKMEKIMCWRIFLLLNM